MTESDHERALLDALQSVETEEKTAEAAPVLSAVTSRNVLKHPDSHPIVLDLLFLRKYGPEWLEWEGATLQFRAPEDFGHVLTDINLSKLQACKTLHLVDTFWQQWEIFLWCTMSFNTVFPDFEVMQVPTVAQCLVSIDCANRIRDDVAWGEEVTGFLEAVYRHDNICLFIPPTPPLDLVLHEGMPEMKELEKLVAQTSKRVEAGREFDLEGEGNITGNTVLDTQVRRRHAAETYLEESRARLQAQLRMVDHAR